MRLPHYRLHALKDKLKECWSVTVKANWRIIFRFEGEDVYDVELRDAWTYPASLMRGLKRM